MEVLRVTSLHRPKPCSNNRPIFAKAVKYSFWKGVIIKIFGMNYFHKLEASELYLILLESMGLFEILSLYNG
jgi:hypothetical protein